MYVKNFSCRFLVLEHDQEFNSSEFLTYELEIDHAIKGDNEQYAIEQPATPIKKTKVYPKDYQKHIIYVSSPDEILDILKD